MRILIGVAIIFCFGVLMGNKTASPEVEFVKIPGKTKVVEKKLPAEKIEVLPESCRAALDAADRLWNGSSALYASGQRQKDIMAEARRALHGAVPTSDIDKKQRELSGDLIGILEDMSEANYLYETYIKECEQ